MYDYEETSGYELGNDPIEEKYRALARDASRALVDHALKPNIDEARAIERAVASPSHFDCSVSLDVRTSGRACVGRYVALS